MRWLASFLAALFVLIALGLGPNEAAALTSGDRHWVKGYTRKDGTYVAGHWAKNPKKKQKGVAYTQPAKSKSAAKSPKSPKPPAVGGKSTSPKPPPPIREKKVSAPKAPKIPSVREPRPSRVSAGGGGSSRGSSSRSSSSRGSSSRR